jgi:hypothetical protein
VLIDRMGWEKFQRLLHDFQLPALAPTPHFVVENLQPPGKVGFIGRHLLQDYAVRQAADCLVPAGCDLRCKGLFHYGTHVAKRKGQIARKERLMAARTELLETLLAFFAGTEFRNHLQKRICGVVVQVAAHATMYSLAQLRKICNLALGDVSVGG